LNLGDSTYIPVLFPHNLSSFENCHPHLRQESRASVPRPLASSHGDAPVQAVPQRHVVHFALHTVLQYLGEVSNLAVVEHLDLRGQQFDDLRTSEVHRDALLCGGFSRILCHQNGSACIYLSTGIRKYVYFSDTVPDDNTHSKTCARLQSRPCMGTWCRRADPSQHPS